MPIVRATLPGTENEIQEHARPKSSIAEATSRPGSPLKMSKNGMSIPGIFIEARKFRLARSVLSLTPRKDPSSGGVQKRTSRKNEVAVFVEEKQKKGKRVTKFHPSYMKKTEHMKGEQQDQESNAATLQVVIPKSITRKRPNKSGLRYPSKVDDRNKNGIQHVGEHFPAKSGNTGKEPSHEWDYGSAVLAEELQQISLQAYQDYQVAGSEGTVQKGPIDTISGALSRDGSLKSQKSNSTVDDDTDEDFVYDTYVRYERLSILSTTGQPKLDINAFGHELGFNSVGILDISTQEDQELWEQFADDQESDKDWNSEEEDENGMIAAHWSMRRETELTHAAEDFYGNDYPEDEIDSEDEMGRGSYDHRKVASDDEEYDENMDAWSQDDKDIHPWKQSMGHHHD